MKRELKKIYYEFEQAMMSVGNNEMALLVFMILFVMVLVFAGVIAL